jgi:hypothetical protein
MGTLTKVLWTIGLSPFFIVGLAFCALSAFMFFAGGAVGYGLTALWNGIWED